VEAREVESLLIRLFEKDGWEVSSGRPPSHGDLRVLKDGIAYAVEIKVAREGRRSLLQAFLADAVLQAQAVARRQEPPIRALAVVAAPVLSEGMTTVLRDYVRAVAPEMAFGLVDGRGRFEFHGDGLAGLTNEPSRKPRRARRLTSPAADLFSDLNQLMLKVLLGRYLTKELLHVQRGRVDGAAQLSRLAGTSLPSAWRFLSSLKEAGFLEELDAGLEVVRLGCPLSVVLPTRCERLSPSQFGNPF
jgi:hypothetical protein